MGFRQKGVARRYDLNALGLLGGPPLRAASIVTEIACESFEAASVAFIVYDDSCGEAVVHAVARRLKVGTRYPLHKAAAALVRDVPDQVQIVDLLHCVPTPAENSEFGMVSMLTAAVTGPDTAPIGALAVLDVKPRSWPPMKQKQLKDMAYLITQEVMLHASFATLELMAGERSAFNA